MKAVEQGDTVLYRMDQAGFLPCLSQRERERGRVTWMECGTAVTGNPEISLVLDSAEHWWSWG